MAACSSATVLLEQATEKPPEVDGQDGDKMHHIVPVQRPISKSQTQFGIAETCFGSYSQDVRLMHSGLNR